MAQLLNDFSQLFWEPPSLNKETGMHLYQLRVVIIENKFDEFVECLLSMLSGFRQEKGCLDYSFYRDVEKVNTFIVVGEWKTRLAMEKHFKGNDFSVLIGAARVLAETFEVSINETSEKGGLKLAKEKILLLANMEQVDQ
jgi:quinol monooxygenase YgiN